MEDQQNEYDFTWETDEGMMIHTIFNGTLRAAVAELSRFAPDDVGADGFVVMPDGSERAIPW